MGVDLPCEVLDGLRVLAALLGRFSLAQAVDVAANASAHRKQQAQQGDLGGEAAFAHSPGPHAA